MSYDMARPRYTLPLAGKEYELVGTFELIEAVEYALKEGIIQVATRVMEMGVADTAKLIAAMVGASGARITPREIGGILFNELGLDTEAHAKLKLHLYAFLRVILAPPSEREAKAKSMGELIGKLESPPASPGETTSVSA